MEHMKSSIFVRYPTLALGILLVIAGLCQSASAASWNGIEPFKSRRDDVIRILGKPISETAEGALRFTVMGGSVQVSFVDEKFVTAKKLKPELAGTVLQIVLQHEASSDTPESMKLSANKSFVKDKTAASTVFRNMKEGIIYTFIGGKLTTTRYSFADDQLGKARRY
jgi:hypothetical protein